ncbi:hypothetical protein GCM10010435_18140 [Winogradskya consettensis]|uniref:Uncharacterized protein n=1 Tax=Winogradskya consettensis TaxID=113560 RepID=A0A919W3N1_9ACTN|nr:hypothetical protein [Actinoplanes consettensis]GIM78538.1 hypothetical protein Aco04nite_60910 [Actinoplanes consettensis]
MFRRHGTKPALALWMLVAIADVALLAAAAGPVLFLLTLAGAGLLAAAAVLITQRRATPQPQPARRRA